MIGAAIPVELVLAAGCRPRLLTARAQDFTRDCAPMEQEHDAEIRSLFVQATDGGFADCDLVVIASTGDGYRYLFQYLREMQRTGRGGMIPPLYLYDFLFADTAPVRAYHASVVDALVARLSAVSGVVVDDAALNAAIVVADASRVAPSEPASGPRIALMSSVALYHDRLHRSVEQAGACVVAQDDPGQGTLPPLGSGNRAALAEHYRRHIVSPRQPTAQREQAFRAILAGKPDGIIFYLPPEDQFYGWSYPALAEAAQQAGVATLLLREDVLAPDNTAQAQVAAFIHTLTQARS